QTTFVSITVPSGWTCTTPAVGSTGAVTCTAGALASGASVTFTVIVKVDPATPNGTVLSNTATVTSTTADQNAGNNSSTATTTVKGAAKGKVTGGGQVVPSTGTNKASFGYIAQRKVDGGPATGHFNYINHDSGL